MHKRKRCRSVQGPIWALCAWRLRPVVSSCSVCRSSSETPHGRNLFLPFHCGGWLRWGRVRSSVCWNSMLLCFCWFGPVSMTDLGIARTSHLHICPVQSQPCVCVWVHICPLLQWRSLILKVASPPLPSYKTIRGKKKKILHQTSCVPSLAPVCIMYSVTLARMIQWQIATW